MDRNIRIYYQTAMTLGLPVTYIPGIRGLRIYLGKKNYYFTHTVTPFNCGASISISKNKYRLNKLLEEAGFVVPKAIAIRKEHFIKYSLAYLTRTLTFPLVAKPLCDTSRGKDVFCNIKDIETLSTYLRQCFNQYSVMQVEEFHQELKEYRVLIFKNRVLGVVERFGAQVVGDGQHSIQQLIDISNVERAKLSDTLTISPMVVDFEYQHCLAEQGLSMESIPPAGAAIKLCHTVNTGRGGDILSHGKKIHPYNARYLCKAAKATGLNVVGLDVLCKDIHDSFKNSQCVIIEANFNPDITIHEIPNRGEKSNVTTQILRQLIFRHPFSYLYALQKRGRFAIYIKSLLIVAVLLGIKWLIHPDLHGI